MPTVKIPSLWNVVRMPSLWKYEEENPWMRTGILFRTLLTRTATVYEMAPPIVHGLIQALKIPKWCPSTAFTSLFRHIFSFSIVSPFMATKMFRKWILMSFWTWNISSVWHKTFCRPITSRTGIFTGIVTTTSFPSPMLTTIPSAFRTLFSLSTFL